MKKGKLDELRSEYRREDLGAGVRGKYLKAYQEGTNLILISPDVAEVFPSEETVNSALRGLIEIAKKSVEPAKRSRKRSKRGATKISLGH